MGREDWGTFKRMMDASLRCALLEPLLLHTHRPRRIHHRRLELQVHTHIRACNQQEFVTLLNIRVSATLKAIPTTLLLTADVLGERLIPQVFPLITNPSRSYASSLDANLPVHVHVTQHLSSQRPWPNSLKPGWTVRVRPTVKSLGQDLSLRRPGQYWHPSLAMGICGAGSAR